MTHAIRTALGSAPIPCAIETQIGAMSAVVAVFDMKFVMIQHRINTTKVNSTGDGFAPNAPITLSAIISPAPVTSNAFARDKVPPNRKMVFRSMDFRASFSENNSGKDQQNCAYTTCDTKFYANLFLKDHTDQCNDQNHQGQYLFPLWNLLKSFVSSKMESSISTVS